MGPAAGQMRSVAPLAFQASMREAARRLDAGDVDVLPVVRDEARRDPAGVVSTADVAACGAAGHDPETCPVERHLGHDFSLALPDDLVETADPAAGHRVRAVLVIDGDRRLQGIIPAVGGSLTVTPAHKVEPMAGGWGGMELVWRCGDCGHTVARPASPPERCPDCGAPREHFVLLTED